MKRVIHLVVLAVLYVDVAQADVVVQVEAPHDDSSIRLQLATGELVKRQRLSFRKFEHLAIADRNKPRNGLRPPYNIECISKAALEAKLGPPVEFDSSLYARPLAAETSIIPGNIKRDDFKGLVENSKFYHLKGTGGIRVFYSAKGVVLSPAVIYLEVDDDFPKLDAKDKMERRLKWEKSKTGKLMKWLHVKPDEIVVTEKELREYEEAKKFEKELIDQLNR